MNDAPRRLPRVAVVWSQFIPVHLDRLVALDQRLHGRFRVQAVEVASSSREYSAFPVSEAGSALDRVTLFPGRSDDQISALRRFWGLLQTLIGARLVCIGLPYSRGEVLPLVLALRLLGSKVVMVYDSKFDDKPRRVWFEYFKRLGLMVYSGAIVAGPRSRQYLRFLGFKRRPIVLGGNSISIDRIRAEAEAGRTGQACAFDKRDFVYVGRFVAVKNLEVLLDGFAEYVRIAPEQRRRLVMIGSGPLEDRLRLQAERLGLADRVLFAGFKSGPALSGAMADALALVLPSSSEPWGLVINEAMAVGLPAIVSEAPGARDLLVRQLVNGCVVETGSAASLGRAMAYLGASEERWRAMSAASTARAWLGDAERFVDAVELLLDPQSAGPAARANQLEAAFDLPFAENRVFQEGTVVAIGRKIGWRRLTG